MSDQRDIVRSAPRSVAAPAGHGDRAAEVVSWCTCSATAIPAPDGRVIVVRVAGEVDLCTVDHLRTVLDSVVVQRPAHVIVDLAELEFCSARGLAVLSEAGDTALGCGVAYAVAGASVALDRVWALGWTAAQRPIGFLTVGDAVLAALAHQVGAQNRARWEPKHLITTRTGTGGHDTTTPLKQVVPPDALIA